MFMEMVKKIFCFGRAKEKKYTDIKFDESDWRKKAVKDFMEWINDLPEDQNEDKILNTLEACDLFTVLSEFASLRQEIKNQNTRHSKTIMQLDSFFEKSRETLEGINRFSGELENLYNKISSDSEDNILKQFFDLREPLERGLAACENVLNKKSFFTRKSEIESIYSGYNLAIKRFDRILSQCGVKVVGFKGEKFDPDFMEAFEIVENGKAKETVHSVVSSGFRRNNRVLRTARVVVNK